MYKYKAFRYVYTTSIPCYSISKYLQFSTLKTNLTDQTPDQTHVKYKYITVKGFINVSDISLFYTK